LGVVFGCLILLVVIIIIVICLTRNRWSKKIGPQKGNLHMTTTIYIILRLNTVFKKEI